MRWTTPTDLAAQVRKLWDRGLLLASLVGGESVFPRRLTLKGPDSRELSERFPEVRDWIAKLSAAAGRYRIEWRAINHRVLGSNQLPTAIWVEAPARTDLFSRKASTTGSGTGRRLAATAGNCRLDAQAPPAQDLPAPD